MINVVELTAKLIQCPTVTPREAGALKLIGELFEDTDFEIHSIDRGGISNLFLRWGKKTPTYSWIFWSCRCSSSWKFKRLDY